MRLFKCSTNNTEGEKWTILPCSHLLVGVKFERKAESMTLTQLEIFYEKIVHALEEIVTHVTVWACSRHTEMAKDPISGVWAFDSSHCLSGLTVMNVTEPSGSWMNRLALHQSLASAFPERGYIGKDAPYLSISIFFISVNSQSPNLWL